MQLFQKLHGFFNPRADQSALDYLPAEAEVSDAVFQKYSMVIGSLFSYFNDLPEESKRKFVKRVCQFQGSKKFHYIGLENNEDIAILVSASAIQITFGLNNYMMSYFKDIYVLADAYHMD